MKTRAKSEKTDSSAKLKTSLFSPIGNYKYSCTPLDKEQLEKIFDKKSLEVFKFLIEQTKRGIPPTHPNDPNSKQFTLLQENFEKWVQQAIGGKCVGTGNRAIDFYKEGEFIADIKSVVAKLDNKESFLSQYSNESSLAQKFKEDCGFNIDTLFVTGQPSFSINFTNI